MELYGVVTMDLVGSRSLENRPQIQEQLGKLIEQINQNHNEFLVAPINFTVGDEWQLVTNHPDKAYDFIHLFQQELWQIGVKFYAGVGIGRISTNLNSDTRRMDGPCFIAAREAIDISKTKPRYGRGRNYIYSKSSKIFFKHFTEKSFSNINKNTYDDFAVYDLLGKTQGVELRKHNTEAAVTSEVDYEKNQYNSFLLSNDNELKLYALEAIINLTIENNEILKDKMTAKQKEIYKQYFNAGSYRKIADENIRSISSISQSLNTAEYYTIQRNHAMVGMLINDYCELLRRKDGL